MAWTINYGGGAGPGIDMSGMIQNEILKRQIAAQGNPALNALGSGFGQGFSQGMGLAIQDIYDRRSEDRRYAREDLRQDRLDKRETERLNAYYDRMAAQQAAIDQRQMALLQEKALQEQESIAWQATQEYVTSTPNPDPLFRLEYEDIVNEHASLHVDVNGPNLPPDQLAMRQQQLRSRIINLQRKIPKQLPPEQRFLQSTVGGDVLNQSVAAQLAQMGQDVNVGQPMMFDNSARYQWVPRGDGGSWTLVEGTGAEYWSKVEAAKAKAASEAQGSAPPRIQYVGQDSPELVGIAPMGTPYVRKPSGGIEWITPPKQQEPPAPPVDQDPEALMKGRQQALKEWDAENPDIPADDRWVDKRARHIVSEQRKVSERGAEENALDGILRENRREAPVIRRMYDSVQSASLDQKLPPEVVAENALEKMQGQAAANPMLRNDPEWLAEYRALAFTLKALEADGER